ncbi:winged helix-turn-helix transcriptional regulator [Reyranella sp.]|uniref:winged helix-turn-helix transcriptional regulator n=1 Tax=Reyranella sp. TaxID=1929291 RepID=UPI003BAB44F4
MTRTDQKVGYEPRSKADRHGVPYTPQTAAADVEVALRIVAGRWKLVILFNLFDGARHRFSDLERAIPAVSQKMLTQQLRQLEHDGVVHRFVHAEVPPRVEYCLTDWGRALCPALDAILVWAAERDPCPTAAPT